MAGQLQTTALPCSRAIYIPPMQEAVTPKFEIYIDFFAINQ